MDNDMIEHLEDLDKHCPSCTCEMETEIPETIKSILERQDRRLDAMADLILRQNDKIYELEK
jgi:hypothetical protein